VFQGDAPNLCRFFGGQPLVGVGECHWCSIVLLC
jgi:hypothetical protein